MPFNKEKLTSPKFYFFYFIIFTIIVLIIFAFIILSYYWNYWSIATNMEKYYRGQQQELSQVFPQILANDPLLGLPDAKVQLFEYSDFTCGACQSFQKDLTALEKFYGPKVLYVYKGLPISLNPESRPAMLAAFCAAEQAKFWEYKNLLFQNPALLTLQTYRQYANQLNLNLEQFNQCLETKKYNTVLDRNLTEALTLQITSVPTIYVNKQKLEGYLSFETIKSLIDQELR
jgi:protein-disulfide isomerase